MERLEFYFYPVDLDLRSTRYYGTFPLNQYSIIKHVQSMCVNEMGVSHFLKNHQGKGEKLKEDSLSRGFCVKTLRNFRFTKNLQT